MQPFPQLPSSTSMNSYFLSFDLERLLDLEMDLEGLWFLSLERDLSLLRSLERDLLLLRLVLLLLRGDLTEEQGGRHQTRK